MNWSFTAGVTPPGVTTITLTVPAGAAGLVATIVQFPTPSQVGALKAAMRLPNLTRVAFSK